MNDDFSGQKRLTTSPYVVSLCRSGGEGSRTLDLVNAIHALSQLSYAPRLFSVPVTA